MNRRWYITCMRLTILAVFLCGIATFAPAQNNGKGNGNANTIPGQVKQRKRMAARLKQAPQQKGVNKIFAGVDPATKAFSPFTTGAVALATMAPNATPDYFGVGNYANSPLPTLTAGGINTIRVTSGGVGYNFGPVNVTIGPPDQAGGIQATASATTGGSSVYLITVTNGGGGYDPLSPPIVTVAAPSPGPGTTAIATPVVSPSGVITSITLTSGGAGYTAIPAVSIDAPPASAPGCTVPCTAPLQAAATAAINAPGGINAITVTFPGSGYSKPPTVTISGSGLGATAIVDSFGTLTAGTGIRKFVNTLPGLTAAGANDLGNYIPLAVADTTTFPGSDFYRIGLREFTSRMHTDLPATGTHLRGYYDMNNPADPNNHYLGPLILATRDRPTRILFQNNLTSDLNIPVDTTYMGAGMATDGTTQQAASKRRATLHLHGGNTPWISDGTTHQWTTPVLGDTQPNKLGFGKGFSFHHVPDMIVPLALDPANYRDGQGTFYWTNQQSGRLLWYHDHAFGLTRLNAYMGEAAGYLLVDPVQETDLQTATVPGTIITDSVTGALKSADLAHVIPLVIQDKTFVPESTNQLPAQDPTWAGGGLGDLWFPHVYMPNQNPADLTGANGFGRWDWGPWFWPPQSPASLLLQAYPCSSLAFNLAQPPVTPAFPPLLCPGVPDPTRPAPANSPSGTPEAFMDTPVINGTAYPTLTVDPTAYRFQVLNGANDRAFNLGLYVAVDHNGVLCDAANTTPAAEASGVACTEVRMVPAVPSSLRTVPDCATALNMGGGGQVTALLDGTGNLLNAPTGLPAGCWPQYNSTFFGPISWPTDGRPGGVPDPATAGPPIIQIGSEGGLMPQVAVIPSTPVSYDYNKRSITVLNVLNHGLLLGGAERADIIVDFSAFAGKTLILYNDAPAPVPASDPRLDYYTGNPDFSPTGGAPSTLPGFGPNTRTIMQIKVNNIAPTTTFSLSALWAAMPNIFAKTQDPVIVPESAYPNVPGQPAGNGNGPDTYIKIQDTGLNGFLGGPIGGITIQNGGGGYTAPVTVAISAPTAPGGTTATAVATLAPTSVGGLTLTAGGSNYSSAPTVTLSGGGGSGATATATLAGRSVASITIASSGSGYLRAPLVTIAGPIGCTVGCATATADATVATTGQRRVTSITITSPGSGYITAPAVTIEAATATGCTTGCATATATSALTRAAVAGLTLTNAGNGYSSAPTVAFSGGGGTGAAATSRLSGAVIASVTMTNPGSGYTAAPTVSFTGGAGTGATAIVTAPLNQLLPKAIQELFTLDYGRMNATLGVEVPFTNFLTQTTIPYGYADPATEIFKNGETQLWKITHNGVDTHFIHFHMFTVQVINRVGWDGALKPPDPNELSFKDTVRMNPLEDIIVALRPVKQSFPFDVPNSYRPIQPVQAIGYTSAIDFTNVDPSNNPVTVVNDRVNFGWEYVWHCHILGHEENDMMRPMIFAVSPFPPSSVTAAVTTVSAKKPQVTLTWVDASINETGFTVQRATSPAGPWTTIASFPSASETGIGGTVTYTDTTVSRNVTYYYQVIANNLVGYTRVFPAPAVGYPKVSADASPTMSNAVTP